MSSSSHQQRHGHHSMQQHQHGITNSSFSQQNFSQQKVRQKNYSQNQSPMTTTQIQSNTPTQADPPSSSPNIQNIQMSRSQSSLNHTHIHTRNNRENSSNSIKVINNNINSPALSTESPLPPVVQRCLGDRTYEKRKNAALEIEALTKSLMESSNQPMIRSIIAVLSKDFCISMNANYRKGGLIGIAAVAIGLMMHTAPMYLNELLPPVLQCFDDPESRVRYYACESLYNIAKVARVSILTRYFNPIFDGLCKLYADPDIDVKNGAGLLDRLVKDIVTETDSFNVDQFIPLLQNYIRRTNPYIRQLLIGWITILDSVPDISMIDYLPDFLDGLFNMLSDSNREIRQAADSALSEFLREVRESAVVEFGPIISILVSQCHSKDRLNRLTTISWLAELISHPYSGGDALLPFHAEILGAIMRCLSDEEIEIRQVSERTNTNLLHLVKKTVKTFQISPLLDTLKIELKEKNDVPTQIAALGWINMLLEKRPQSMNAFIADLLPVLLTTLSDPSDDVVLLNLQVLSRIALAKNYINYSKNKSGSANSDDNQEPYENDQDHEQHTTVKSNLESDAIRFELIKKKKKQFQMVLDAILSLFANDPVLLETRGSLIVRKLCVLLEPERVYITMASSLVSNEAHKYSEKQDSDGMESTATKDGIFSIEFIGKMVQTLNLILLSAAELHSLRTVLANTFEPPQNNKHIMHFTSDNNTASKNVFPALFHCWCHNPVSTFSLCLLAKAYDLAYTLIRKFTELEVTVGFLMQVDKLVQLLESPVFINLRIQLLDIDGPHHNDLLKSCYGLLMLLPQSNAFRTLNDRLSTVCHLRDNLSVPPLNPYSSSRKTHSDKEDLSIDSIHLLERFDDVIRLRSQVIWGEQSGAGESIMKTIPQSYLNHHVSKSNDGKEQQLNSSASTPSTSHISPTKTGGKKARQNVEAQDLSGRRATAMMILNRGDGNQPSLSSQLNKVDIRNFNNSHHTKVGRGRIFHGVVHESNVDTLNSARSREMSTREESRNNLI